MKFIAIFIIISTFVSCASNDIRDKSPEEKKADLYYGHGTQALLEKDYTTALAHLQKAAEIAPEDSKIQNNLGMALYFKGEKARAISHLQKAIDLDKKNSDARVNLAGIYYAQDRVDLAFDQYTLVAKDLIYPHQYRTYYNMAIIKEKQGRIAEARSLIAKAISENKLYCPAHYFEGKMNEKVLNWKAALASYQDATKGQCYEEPAPHYSQAQMLIKLGRYNEAKEKLEMVMEKFSRSPYFAMSSQQLNALRKTTISDKQDYIQKARLEMEKLRDQEADTPKTFKGTSF
tara:strand:- start:2172 stop:3038 length:867 start_codon:yes stop_codon:yes gene_type:complete